MKKKGENSPIWNEIKDSIEEYKVLNQMKVILSINFRE